MIKINDLIEREINFLLEHPSQAIKILKDNNLDPDNNPNGKKILDDIIEITNGNGYTGMLTLFHLKDKLTIEDITSLYNYIKQNKESVKLLPKPIFNYQRYRDLRADLDRIEKQKSVRQLYKELPSKLKQEVNNLKDVELEKFNDVGLKFIKLEDNQKKFFKKTISGYNNINDLIDRLNAYVISIENGEDMISVYNKIENTDGAEVVHVDKEKNILIAFIRKFDASMKLGCTTSWCITRDRHYWTDYKKGGNAYFFIWDFNYSSENPEYLVGTAYNKDNPSNSQTHIKNNQSANLLSIFNKKSLDMSVLSNALATIREKYLSNIKDSGGFMEALKSFNDGSQELLLDEIKNSNLVNQHGSPEDVYKIYRDTIETSINKNSWLEILEIDEDGYNEYENYYNNYDINYDEVDYMHNVLDDNNIALINSIAEKIGSKFRVNNDINDGELALFLKENGFDNINDTYLDLYNDAGNTAKEREVESQLSELPVDIENGTIDISNILEKIQDKNIQVDTFDEYISEFIGAFDFSYETLNDAMYSNVDYDELNIKIKDMLTSIIDDFDDPDSELYEKSKYNIQGSKILNQLNFKQTSDRNRIIKLDNGGKIVVKNIEAPYVYQKIKRDYDGISDEGSFYVDIYKENKKVLSGNIRFSNLYKYVTQHSIPFKESREIFKRLIRNEMKNLIK